MKKFKEGFYIAVIIVLVSACTSLIYAKQWQPKTETKVYYNRDEQLNNMVIDTILQADHFAYFAIYTFTREDIKDALLGAKRRGVDVRGLSDKKQYYEIGTQRKIINELRNSGIPVGLQNHDAIMHLKVLVTDKAFVSGSYNWTASATTSNDEVIEIGTSEPVRKQYYEIIKKLILQYPLE